MQIRDAKLEDLAVILDIYNEVIATSTAIYNDDPLNPASLPSGSRTVWPLAIRCWWPKKTARFWAFPVLAISARAPAFALPWSTACI
jgi:L-amino acid N-acyltransferase YncA